MRSTLWVLSPEADREAADAVVGRLAGRGLGATVREAHGGYVVVLDGTPDPDEPLPESVVRTARVELPGDWNLSRRSFIDGFALVLAGVCTGAAAGIAAGFASPPERQSEGAEEVDAGSLADLKKRGSLTFRFGREPCILVWSNDDIFALSMVCTHLGCLVEWSAERAQLVCPCHRAAFDVRGNVLEGPPPRPLASFAVALQDDRVLVRRRATR